MKVLLKCWSSKFDLGDDLTKSYGAGMTQHDDLRETE